MRTTTTHTRGHTPTTTNKQKTNRQHNPAPLTYMYEERSTHARRTCTGENRLANQMPQHLTPPVRPRVQHDQGIYIKGHESGFLFSIYTVIAPWTSWTRGRSLNVSCVRFLCASFHQAAPVQAQSSSRRLGVGDLGCLGVDVFHVFLMRKFYMLNDTISYRRHVRWRIRQRPKPPQ